MTILCHVFYRWNIGCISKSYIQSPCCKTREEDMQKYLYKSFWPPDLPPSLHVVKSLTSNSGNVSLLEVMTKISKETKMKIIKMAKNTSSQAISKELCISRSKDQGQPRWGHPKKLQHRMVYRNWSEQQKIGHKKMMDEWHFGVCRYH